MVRIIHCRLVYTHTHTRARARRPYRFVTVRVIETEN